MCHTVDRRNMRAVPISCLSCRRLKRKCSKERPACSLCVRVGRVCDYSNLSSPEPTDANFLRQRQQGHANDLNSAGLSLATVSQMQKTKFVTIRNNFPEVWFLDSALARGLQKKVVHQVKWIDITNAQDSMSITEARLISNEYFKTVHIWLPICTLLHTLKF